MAFLLAIVPYAYVRFRATSRILSRANVNSCFLSFLAVRSCQSKASVASTNLPRTSVRFPESSPRCTVFGIPATKTFGPRERPRPPLVPSALFRALWIRRGLGDMPIWLSRDRWRDTLFRQRPSSNGLGSISHASPCHPPPLTPAPCLPTYLPNRYADPSSA